MTRVTVAALEHEENARLAEWSAVRRHVMTIKLEIDELADEDLSDVSAGESKQTYGFRFWGILFWGGVRDDGGSWSCHSASGSHEVTCNL